jgi:hypothetical protein
VYGALKLHLVDMAVSAADLPAAEADRRNVQVGLSEWLEIHGRPRPWWLNSEFQDTRYDATK